MKQRNLNLFEIEVETRVKEQPCDDCKRMVPDSMLTSMEGIGDVCPDCNDFHCGVVQENH